MFSLYTHRCNYWSLSAPVKWVRKQFGLKNPGAMTLEGWKEHKETSKKIAPIVNWLTDVGIDKVQDIVCFPSDIYRTIYEMITNRFVDKCHALTSSLPKWQYHEIDTRMLHCNFQTLVDYVEVEYAWNTALWNDDINDIKWYHETAFLQFLFPYRSPVTGIAGLERDAQLKYDCNYYGGDAPLSNEKVYEEFGERAFKPTPQAEAAAEILELYRWYKAREYRVDPYEAGGVDVTGTDIFSIDSVEGDFDLVDKLEKQYDDEDTEMLIRLMKIRHHLWT